MRKPQWLPVAAFPVLLLLGAATIIAVGLVAFIAIKAQHTLNNARQNVASQGDFAFDIRDLAPISNPGFESIASPATYASGAWFDGHFYLSGSAGLSVFAADGELLKTYRVGIELPTAPLGQIVAGRLRGTSESQLLIATSGEGVLIFFSLHRQDGSGIFRQLRPRQKDARDITALLPLPSGELLIGSRHRGLLVYRGSALTGSPADARQLTLFNPQFAQLDITALTADASGFWVGTHDRGVLHWNAGQTDSFQSNDEKLSGSVKRTSFSPENSPSSTSHSESDLPDNQVLSIAVNGNKAYIATPVGVEEFTSGVPTRELAPGIFANTLFADDKELVVGSIDQGIQTIPLNSVRSHNLSHFQFSDSQSALARDTAQQFLSANNLSQQRESSTGHTRIAVMRDGLHRQEPLGAWVPLQPAAPARQAQEPALTDSNISALAFAPDGQLWVGYFDRGLDILAANLVQNGTVAHLEDDHLFCINRIALDPRRNTMAVAAANGLTLFDAQGKPRQTLTQKDGLIADHINDVLFRSNQMVVATPAGLTFIDQAGARSLYSFEGLVNNHVYTLAAQPGGSELLAGTLGGISLLEDETIKRNLTANNSGLKHNWITAILPIGQAASGQTMDQSNMQKQNGSWMVGTYGAGIMQLSSDGSFTPMQGATRDMIINPNALFATSVHIFAGSLGQGLWVWSRSTTRWTQITAGLPSENVTAITEHANEIYVGTDNGLVRIAESALP